MKKIFLVFVSILCGCKTIPVEHRVRVLYNGRNTFATYEMRFRDEIPKNYD